jgi:hypothetical protein
LNMAPISKNSRTDNMVTASLDFENSPDARAHKQAQPLSGEYGRGPGLKKADKDLGAEALLQQISGLDKITKAVLDATQDSDMKTAILQLQLICKTCASLLKNRMDAGDEIHEERRNRSLVISNVPESTSPSSIRRVKDDVVAVEEILETCEVEGLPLNVYRMGKLLMGRPRLIKAEFACRAHRNSFLANRGKLKNVPKLSRIFVRPSLTMAELDIKKSMYCERNKLNDELTTSEKENDPYVVYGPPDALKIIKRSEIHRR